jgi:RNA polymerase sigma factor (sigma-70 family)
VAKGRDTVVRYIGQMLGGLAASSSPDQELLASYVGERNQAAFEALVQRHGPMVLRVCRRVLHDHQAIEDAFQATFFILAAKANSITRRELLASWLYGVAYRTAVRTKASSAKWYRRAALGESRSPVAPPAETAARELCEALDEELNRLPARYHKPLVLCYLEGRTRVDAARQLSWSLRTLERRLGQGRAILQVRLARRGLTLSGALLAVGLSGQAAGAAPPILLLTTTVAAAMSFAAGIGDISRHAAILAERGLQTMYVAKVQIAIAFFVTVTAIIAGAGGLALGELPGTKAVPNAIEPASQHAPNPPPASTNTETSSATDLHGDPLPLNALYRFGTVRQRHGSGLVGIGSSALSPDGKFLASTGSHSVIVWNLESGKPVHRFRCENGPHFCSPGITFSPDGKLLAHVRSSDLACVWDLTTGKELRRFKGEPRFPSSMCLFTSDSKELILSEEKQTRFWRLESGDPTRSFPAGNLALVSPDTRTYVRIEERKALILGDTQSGQETSRWDVSTVHDGLENGVAFAPDGKTLAFVHQRKEIQIRELIGGKVQALFPLPDSARHKIRETENWQYQVGFSTDGNVLLLGTAGGLIHRWDLASGRKLTPLGKHLREVTGFHSLPDGRTLISTGADAVIRRWDLETGKEMGEPECYVGQTHAAFSPDAHFAAIGDSHGRVDLWDAINGKPLRVLRQSGAAVNNLAFAPDGKSLSAGLTDGTVGLWDVASAEQTRVLKWQGKLGWTFAYSLLFSPEGRYLCVSNYPERMRFWEVSSGKEVWGNRCPAAVAVSPDGATIAAAFGGPHLTFLDAATGKERFHVRLNSNDSDGMFNVVQVLAFSLDGRRLAMALRDGHVSICDGHTGTELKRFRAVEPPEGAMARMIFDRGHHITALSFSPDGKWLLSGGADTTVRVWEVATAKEAYRFEGHEGEVTQLGFKPDMHAVFSAGSDGQAYLWRARLATSGKSPSPEVLWNDLADAEAAKGYRAVWELCAHAESMASFLLNRIIPAKPVDEAYLAKLITDLDSDRFPVREAAAKALAGVGGTAAPTMDKALKGRPAPEARRRLELLLEALKQEPGLEEIRRTRAVQGLELAGTPKACETLRAWAEGASGSRLTEDAKGALARLKKPPRGMPGT